MLGKKPKAGSLLREERGQSIVLVAIMILSFLMFFSFTLNTGLLIHAKISVQSAADAAAYAGAATQARYLNGISFLNYDMRRQYKKFLFRNVFIGALGSPNFPATSTGATTGPYDFPKLDYSGGPGTAVKTPLRVPVVCLSLAANGMMGERCTQFNLRDTAYDIKQKISPISVGGGSPIIQALINGINNISGVVQKTCVGQNTVNQTILLSWLFKGVNTKAFADNLVNAWNSTGTDATQTKNLISGLISGLGLYPRNILNLMRIRTLRDFLNTQAKPNLDLDQITAMEADENLAETRERTILAFKSALANLNSSVFDPEKLTLDELMPPAPLVELEEDTAGPLNVFYQASIVDGSASPGDPGTYCKNYAKQVTLSNIPIGVRIKKQTRYISYAVKVTARIKPRGLLFAPWSDDLELVAIAGAKPFGSRVGPQSPPTVTDALQMDNVRINKQRVCDSSTLSGCVVPQITVAAGKNFYDTEFLKEMKSIATSTSGSGSTFSLKGVLKAQYLASAPNPTEVGQYGILPPPEEYKSSGMGLEFIPYWDPKTTPKMEPAGLPDLIPVYRFYAPLYPKSKPDFGKLVKDSLAFLKNTNLTGADQYGWDASLVYDEAEKSILEYHNNYLENLIETENKESKTFAAIELPMLQGMPGPQNSSGIPFWLVKKDEVLTSWGPEYIRAPGGFWGQPRFGFSVKHVAVRDLVQQGIPSIDDELEDIAH